MEKQKVTQVQLDKFLLDRPLENNSRSHLIKDVDFSDLDFRELDLSRYIFENCDFCNTKFIGCDLSCAIMRNCDLTGCFFIICIMYSVRMNNCILVNSDWSKCNVDISSVNGCDISNMILYSCFGCSDWMHSLFVGEYPICYTNKILHIGCVSLPIETWKKWDSPAGREFLTESDFDAIKTAEAYLNIILDIVVKFPVDNNSNIEHTDEYIVL